MPKSNPLKSQRGCIRCRRRKVKCDEATPVCSNCVRRRDQCCYPVAADEEDRSFTRSQSQNPAPQGVLIEIELTHHFLIETCPSFMLNPMRVDLWRRCMFPLGYEVPALLDALLATAAMHIIATATPLHNVSKYVSFAVDRQATGLSKFISMLSTPTEDNALAIFGLSSIVTIWAFASRAMPHNLNIISRLPTEGYHDKGPINIRGNHLLDLLEIVRLSSGIYAVVVKCGPWIHRQGLGHLFQHHEPQVDRSDGCSSLEDLKSFMARQPHVSFPYSREIDRTEYYLQLGTSIDSGTDNSIGWLVGLTPEYIDALTARDPAALVILAYWCVRIRAYDDKWWARGWGNGLLKEINDQVEGEWRRFLGWPMEESADYLSGHSQKQNRKDSSVPMDNAATPKQAMQISRPLEQIQPHENARSPIVENGNNHDSRSLRGAPEQASSVSGWHKHNCPPWCDAKKYDANP